MACLLVAGAADSPCSQTADERNKLIDEAQRNEFTLRRAEFVGNTYTRDQVLRERMTPIINEGDVFTRDKLVRSLRRMSALKKRIYPLRLKDVELRLDRSKQLIDITICFKERPRSSRKG